MLSLSMVMGNLRRMKVQSPVMAILVIPTVVPNLPLVGLKVNQGEAVSEDVPEMETGGDTTLSPTVAAAPGDLEMDVDRDENIVLTQTMESTPVAACAIVVRNHLSVADAVAGATFNPPYLVPHPDHVLIGGFSVPSKHAGDMVRIEKTNKRLVSIQGQVLV